MWRDHSYTALYAQNIPHVSFECILSLLQDFASIYWTLFCVDRFALGGQNQLSFEGTARKFLLKQPKENCECNELYRIESKNLIKFKSAKVEWNGVSSSRHLTSIRLSSTDNWFCYMYRAYEFWWNILGSLTCNRQPEIISWTVWKINLLVKFSQPQSNSVARIIFHRAAINAFVNDTEIEE